MTAIGDDGAALLAAISAAPDDDLPRLVYADWLDDRAGPGDAERAEFIRVQCDLAKMPEAPVVCRPPLVDGRPDRYHERFCPYCLWCDEHRAKRQTLTDRSHLLVSTYCDRWAGFESARSVGIDDARPGLFLIDYAADRWEGEFRRGFIDSVTCPAADWIAHGDALLARHPVREVRLTTRPPEFSPYYGNAGEWGPVQRYSEAEGRLETARWPGVRFHLPEPALIGFDPAAGGDRTAGRLYNVPVAGPVDPVGRMVGLDAAGRAELVTDGSRMVGRVETVDANGRATVLLTPAGLAEVERWGRVGRAAMMRALGVEPPPDPA